MHYEDYYFAPPSATPAINVSMAMLRRKYRHQAIGVVLFMLAIAAPAFGSGYWNVPSSCWQNMGFGCGGGYHAPLVLGPVNCREAFRHNHFRLPYAPSPPPCAGCSESFAAPSVLEQTPAPTPAVDPTSRTPRLPFLP